VRDFQGSEKFRKHLMVVHSQNVETINLDTPVLQLTNDLNKSSFEHESNHICSAPYKTSSTSYNNIIINCVLEFITSLYTKPTVTEILIQQIIDGVSMLFSSELILHLKNKVMSLLEMCSTSDKNEIVSMFHDLENPFLNFKTEYQRMKYFESNNLIFKSKTIVLGFTSEKKNVSDIDKLIMVPVQGHLLPIKQNLKLFFELPGVYNTALEYTENAMKQKDILTSFLNGSTWKSIKCKFFDKIVFPIFLYYDDAEMGNPLGSHSGIHKMGCVYYTVPAFPPEYLSSLDNIFPAFLFHSSDRGSSKFNNKTIFASLIKVLIDLQENGISISVNSVNIQVYFVLGLVLGDNLGLNSILGFVESFSANYYCRFCYSHKTILQKMLFESTEYLRNVENYKLDVQKANVSETGICELCVFNEIPNYHVTVNSVCDFMHDVTEGVARYDMALIITHLIKDQYFTLECLNNRIMLFEYGFSEKKNSPPAINQNNLNNGCIIMSSSEMLCLVRYFGLIVGELIPIKTEVWELYLSLRQIIDICCSRKIQPECSYLLNNIVAEHNRLYLLLSQSTLKPKFHFLTHYGSLLIKNGPLILTSSIRFEAKHKILKAFSNSIPCRINLGYTLTNKLQLQMMNRYLTQTGLRPDLKLGQSSIISPTVEIPSSFLKQLPIELKSFVSWMDFKGISYRVGMVLVLEVTLDSCIFGKIIKIVIGTSMIPYIIFIPLITIGFDSHFHAYQIELNSELQLFGSYLTNLPDPTPTVIRTLTNGTLFVSLRYAL